MKITLTIDTSEPYSDKYNLFELLNMALETVDNSKNWGRQTTENFTTIEKETYSYGIESRKPRRAKAIVCLEVVK